MGNTWHGSFTACPLFFFSFTHTHTHSLFINVIAHEGEDIVIQGIICLIGAISHPMLSCQMALFPWSLPVFTVTCHGRALSGTEGLSTQEWTVFQSSFGVLRLLPSPPTCSPCCSFAGCLCAGAPGPILRQTWLIERKGYSLLISSDSSVLPEVGVPPHAESFHSKITALLWKTQTMPRLPRQFAKRARWIFRTEERGETHFVCFTTSGTGAVPAFSENLTGNLPFHSGLEWNVTMSF